MKKIYKKIEIKAINCNFLDTKMNNGIISLFSIHGLTKNIELKLNNIRSEKIKINYFLPFFIKVSPNEGRKAKASDIKAKGLDNIFTGYVHLNLIIELESKDIENINKILEIFLKKSRLGGGNIIYVKVEDLNEDKRIWGLYPKINETINENPISFIKNNILYYQKGIRNVLRIGELILSELDKKGRFGHNLVISSPILSEVEFKRQKGLNIKNLFNENKMSVIKENKIIKIKQGE